MCNRFYGKRAPRPLLHSGAFHGATWLTRSLLRATRASIPSLRFRGEMLSSIRTAAAQGTPPPAPYFSPLTGCAFLPQSATVMRFPRRQRRGLNPPCTHEHGTRSTLFHPVRAHHMHQKQYQSKRHSTALQLYKGTSRCSV